MFEISDRKECRRLRKKGIVFLLVLAVAAWSVLPASAAVAVMAPQISSASLNMKTGDTARLNVTLGASDVTFGVIWTSDTPAVATVSGGTVRAVGPGTATVTATTGDGRSARCSVRVAFAGIDVSSHQSVTSWSDVKNAGIGFALLRTGYGDEASQADGSFAANYDGAVAAGIQVGAYHLSYATTTDDAVLEANICLGILAGRHLDYPVFLDIEPNVSGHEDQAALTNDQLSAIAAAFCGTIEKAGYRAGIYSNVYSWNSRLTGSSLAAYDKWVAHYGVDEPGYDGAYTVWQYSEEGTVAGVSGMLDLDYSYRSYPSAAVPSDISILSDTPASITLVKGKTYTFKFIPNGVSGVPAFTSGNSSAVKVISQVKYGGCYYVKIKGTGAGSTSLYSRIAGQNALRRCVVTVN